ncbi:hypothetical protein OH764_34665 (plasmid) [Burkholderia sp. M6-3]
MECTYLNVRVDFARAKVASITNPATHLFGLAMADAQALGYRDAESSGLSEPPVPKLFADEPKLVHAWQDGVIEWESEGEYMDMCSFCFGDHLLSACPRI